MKLKSEHNKSTSSKKIFLGVVTLLLLLLVFQLVRSKKSNSPVNAIVSSIETATQTNQFYNFSEIIEQEINTIFEDETVAIYLNENLGLPFLLYAYKAPFRDDFRTDNFFVHFYLEDDTALKKQRKINYLNFDFKPFKPIELVVDGNQYYIFKRILDDQFFDFDNIKYLNTGRFNPAGGVRSQDIKKLEIDNVDPKPIASDLDKLVLKVSQKSYQKIQAKRENAINNNVLLTSDEDLVNGQVAFQNLDFKEVKTRLKGDWTDHLNDPIKWSYRIIMDGDATIAGMRKFSIQHPKSRNYMWEWLFNKVIKENDLIGLRYEFVEVDLALTEKNEVLKTLPLGIMAMEESFDKILIENNQRREGIILAFDESVMWNEREQFYKLKLNEDRQNGEFIDTDLLPIKVFNEGKVLADPNLSKQFDTAKELLQGLREKRLKISEVFDIDKLTTYTALVNLFGGDHGLADHNMRAYYNPITGKLEPISFDSYSGMPLTKIHNYPFSEDDEIYSKKLMEKLQWVSDANFVNEIATNYLKDMKKLHADLSAEFNLDMNLSVLDFNSNFIKKKINPANLIVASVVNYSRKQIDVSIKNIAEYPVVIENLTHKDGKKLNVPKAFGAIPAGETKKISFQLKDAFVNAFVSKKNKVGEFRFPKDVEKLRIAHHLQGVEHQRTENIAPYDNVVENSPTLKSYEILFKPNSDDFAFVALDEENKKITFQKGDHVLTQSLILPKGYVVIIEPGFNLDMKKGASLVSFSALKCEGTADTPIRFFSSESDGAGIFVNGPKEKSLVTHTIFSNLSNPTSEIWNLSGAVNFHETEVEIKNAVFEKNRCEDGLNIIRSTFTLTESNFLDTKSDAFDGDFVEGSIHNTVFKNSGNDGIDVSGSDLFLRNVRIENSSDKAISAGENSRITGEDIEIIGGEIGIVSKDLSEVNMSNIHMTNTRLGFSSFQKKSEYGKATIAVSSIEMKSVELAHLIENGCTLIIDDSAVETVSNNVIDQMYGKEYGKSTR